MSTSHSVVSPADGSLPDAAVERFMFGAVVTAVLVLIPILLGLVERPADQWCADDPERFALVTRLATDAVPTFTPCFQDSTTGEVREVLPAPGAKIRIGDGPAGLEIIVVEPSHPGS